MIKRLFESFFGTSSERKLKTFTPFLAAVNAL